MNHREFLQKAIYAIVNPIVKGFIALGVSPNMITTIGFVGNIVAACLFLQGMMLLGGIVILAAGLFDMLDGRIARLSGKASVFGALYDSVMDRYSELVSLFPIVLYFVKIDNELMAITTFIALIGSIMVSYVRARAEGLDIECKVGFMQRPERVVALALGAILTGALDCVYPLAIAICLIAVLANITAIWRIVHCYKRLN